MDAFLDNSQLSQMKRKYESLVGSKKSDITIRHNLIDEFEEPNLTTKSPRLGERSFVQNPIHLMSPTETIGLSDSPPLSRQLKLKEAEIAFLKASITKLENHVAAIQREREKASIDHDNEIAEVKMAKDREIKKASDLKSKLQYVMEREKNARDEVHRLEREIQQQAIESDKKLLAEQKERIECSDKAQQAKTMWLDEENKLHKKIVGQRHEIMELQNKLEESLAQTALKNNFSAEVYTSKKKIEQLEEALQAERKKNRDLESRFAEQEDNIITTKALKADLDMVPSMKSELEKIRQDNEVLRLNEQNTLLLEEEIRGLKKKLGQVDSLREKVIQLEVINEELKDRLSRWEIYDSSGSRRPHSPSSLSRRAQELETDNASLLVSQGEMESRVNICERKVKQANAEIQRLSAALSAEKNISSQLNDLQKRLKKKMLLQSKERDAYKTLLDSYESEVTVNFDIEKARQIQRLEALLHEHKELMTESETQIESLSLKLAESQTNFEHVQQQLQNVGQPVDPSSQEDKETIKLLREQNAVLENEMIKIREERDNLDAKIEQRHLQGDYDPTKTKIIHFLENPYAIVQRERQAELERLRDDNEKLKKRNQILEENGGNVEDITMQVEEKLQHLSPRKEVEDLKLQLASAEMRNQRLKEVFSKTSKEFREVCYQLTGYKLDIPCANQYRLTSMYAERQKDYLLFQQNAQGDIQLLQTDFSMTFQDAMENYLQKMKSLPLFLSHITMELFNRQTMSL